MTESFGGDNVRMHERTFRLCAPYSCSQLLVRVVRGALVSAVKFTMIIPKQMCFLAGARCTYSALRLCVAWHVHTDYR